ncbi:MAG: hypothetical protein KC609_01380 [Myxococcales bacterium]|nr:hypothetical protein [Myxococcales bacterium]
MGRKEKMASLLWAVALVLNGLGIWLDVVVSAYDPWLGRLTMFLTVSVGAGLVTSVEYWSRKHEMTNDLRKLVLQIYQTAFAIVLLTALTIAELRRGVGFNALILALLLLLVGSLYYAAFHHGRRRTDALLVRRELPPDRGESETAWRERSGIGLIGWAFAVVCVGATAAMIARFAMARSVRSGVDAMIAAVITGVVVWVARYANRRSHELLDRGTRAFFDELKSNLAERFAGSWTISAKAIRGAMTFKDCLLELEFTLVDSPPYRFRAQLHVESPHRFVLAADAIAAPDERSERFARERLGDDRVTWSALLRQLASERLELGPEGVAATGMFSELNAASVYRLIAGLSRLGRQLTSAHVGRAFLAKERCPYCRDTFETEEPHFDCMVCSTRHHLECWRDHGNRCAVFGCSSIHP